jgi:hypothetical protein
MISRAAGRSMWAALLMSLLFGMLAVGRGESADGDPRLHGVDGFPAKRPRLLSHEETALIDKPRIADPMIERRQENPDNLLKDVKFPYDGRAFIIEALQPTDGSQGSPRKRLAEPKPPSRHFPEILGITVALLFFAGVAFHAAHCSLFPRKKPPTPESR